MDPLVLSAESWLAAAVALLAISVLPLIASSLAHLFDRSIQPLQAILSAAVVLGCFGLCGLLWGQRLGGAQGWLVLLFSLVLLKVGLGLAVIFCWRGFRAASPTAAWLALGLLLLLAVSLALDLLTVRTDGRYPEQTLGFRFGQPVTSLPFLWLAVESALVSARLRRRPAADEVSVLAARRLRLWSIVSVLLFLECLLALAASLDLLAPARDALLQLRALLYGLVAVCTAVSFYGARGAKGELPRLA